MYLGMISALLFLPRGNSYCRGETPGTGAAHPSSLSFACPVPASDCSHDKLEAFSLTCLSLSVPPPSSSGLFRMKMLQEGGWRSTGKARSSRDSTEGALCGRTVIAKGWGSAEGQWMRVMRNYCSKIKGMKWHQFCWHTAEIAQRLCLHLWELGHEELWHWFSLFLSPKITQEKTGVCRSYLVPLISSHRRDFTDL